MEVERINRVIQQDATTSSIGDFLLTHVPFENLYLDPDGLKSISENNLLETILEMPEEHKFIMVQGGDGSGKSHLIRWLKEKYSRRVDPSHEAILLISRAHNTLQDAMAQLLEADIFTEEIRENELKTIKNARSNITGEELKKTINFNFTLEIDADANKPDAIIDLRIRKWLVDYLNNTYIQNQFLLIPGGPIERIRQKIETVQENVVIRGDEPAFVESDFAISLQQIKSHLNIADGRASDYVIRLAEKFADTRVGAELRQKTADYLNTKVSGVIQRSMKLRTADFQKLFASLRKTLKDQGMNLTLFIEDINSFTGIDEALMEVLLANHKAEGNSQYCRLVSVVGSTTAFYRDKLNASIKGRIRNNIYILNKAVLGSAEQLAVFAAKYINAINQTDAQVKKWYEAGADDTNIPVYTSSHKWADVDFHDIKLSIFPFNKMALWKLFNALPVEKKTPRILLGSIIAHVLKLWALAPEQFLSNENNFVNADIRMPRWESSLYSNANNEMDQNSATERGILLRLWGDGTTKNESGRLGGLTEEVFKTFGVYAKITGTPEPESKVIPIPPASPLSKEHVQVPLVYDHTPSANSNERPTKLVEIESDLDQWLTNGGILKNHIDLRNMLYPFITSAIDWELECVPQLLVLNNLSSLNRVHIEGQNVSIGEGFVLPRSRESYDLLTALVNWYYVGNRSWHFEGGPDYIVAATVWVEKNKRKLIECVKAPQGRFAEWNLPLWNIAAVYGIKILFGGVDITKTDQEIALDLLGKVPDFDKDSVHSEEWDSMKETVVRNPDYKERIIKETLALFSKSVGSAEAGETKYTFVDAEELLKCVAQLRARQWNLKGLCPLDVPKSKNSLYLSVNFVNMFTENLENVIDCEIEYADKYLNLFAQALDGDYSEAAIADSLEAIRAFLQYLTNSHNLSYADEDYRVLKTNSAPKRFAESLARMEGIKSKKSEAETLRMLSFHPFDDIELFYKAIVSFNNLLNEKERLFKNVADTASMQSINNYKSSLYSELSDMAKEIQEFGGSNNGKN